MDKDKINRWLEVKIANEGISLRELARRANVNQAAISNVLNEKRDATLDFYIKLAETFGGAAVVDMLKAGEVLPTEEAIRGSFLELFKLINRMSPEAQQEAESYLNYLIEKEKRQPNQVRRDNSDLATDGGASR